MAEDSPSQNRPSSPEQAPDPSFSYERSHPEREAGMGQLDAVTPLPSNRPDRIDQAVPQKQKGNRQLNAHDVVNEAGGTVPQGAPPGTQPADRAKHEVQAPPGSALEQELKPKP